MLQMGEKCTTAISKNKFENAYVSHALEILLLVIYSRENLAQVHQETCTQLFTGVVYTVNLTVTKKIVNNLNVCQWRNG